MRTARLPIAETGVVTEVRRMIVNRRRQALEVLTDLALPGVSTW